MTHEQQINELARAIRDVKNLCSSLHSVIQSGDQKAVGELANQVVSVVEETCILAKGIAHMNPAAKELQVEFNEALELAFTSLQTIFK